LLGAVSNDESDIVIMGSDSNVNIESYVIINMDSDIIDDSFIEFSMQSKTSLVGSRIFVTRDDLFQR
jgi:hypothetical protein